MIYQILQASIGVGSVALAIFCMVLARRLRRLNDLETGLGGAIAVMTAEIARLETAIRAARDEATVATQRLAEEVERAKQERAFWVLQRKFSDAQEAGKPAETPPRQRRRLRAARPEVSHEAA
ncbi:hypothetical protein [Paracoccus pacificus]|uniref:Chemotaxis protein n=1 Tax=Paracoccus pacificus TaxID=1463598 RepID=A0ABW4RBX9_9RHOB